MMSPLESLTQKLLKSVYRRRGRHSRAHSLRIDLFTLTDDGHYLLGWGGGGEIVAHACENSGFLFVPLNVQIQIIFLKNSMTL